MNKYHIFFLLISTISWGLQAPTQHERKAEYWNFSSLEDTVSFPNNFLWGCAVAEYQVSGAQICRDSNWAAWERKSGIEASGSACDFWNRCFDDIELIKKLGVKAFRFSVDWSLIEPVQGQYNETALDHYELFCKKLLENGIQPVVTLHHFVHPEWFEKKGAFEKEENIRHFVEFSAHVFRRLNAYVHLWCTINEPNLYVFCAYIRGAFPPGKLHMQKAAVTLGNLLKAHVAVYKKLKTLPGGPASKIGIIYHPLPFKPFHIGGIRGPLEQFAADTLNDILNESVLEFFKTGTFLFSVPRNSAWAIFPRITAYINFKLDDARTALDFVGLNNYSHVKISLNAEKGYSEGYHDHDIKTDMPYPFYPEGLYHAIVSASELKVPIYITENGIADAQDDRRRLWIERYLYAVGKAIEDGYDVRGFFYWSLLDNYEWDMGYPLKFGLYHVDLITQKRTLREGAKTYQEIVKNNGLRLKPLPQSRAAE